MSNLESQRAVATALSRRVAPAVTPRQSGAVTALFAVATFFVFLNRSTFALEPLEEIVEQKYTVDANATLSVANTDGSIRVYAAEASEIFILAIKKAYTRDRLQGIAVDVKATQNSVAVSTSFPP